MKTLKGLVKIWSIRLGVALALSFLGVGLINSKPFDETLNAELKAYLSQYPKSDVHDNAFTSMYGLVADPSKDMRQVGASVVEALKGKREQGQAVMLSEHEMLSLTGERLVDSHWRAHFTALDCLPGTFSMCWPELIKDVRVKALGDESVRILVARYEQIISMPHHVEFAEMDMHSPLPPYNELLAIGKLRLAELIAQGDDAKAMALLEKEMRFWRMVLHDSQSVIGKMVAVRGLSDRIQFISQIILARSEVEQRNIDKIVALITPLTREELDISEAVLHELRVVYSMHELNSVVDHGKIGEALITWTTQKNASYNTYFEQFVKPTMALSKRDSPSFKRERALFRVGLNNASRTFLPNMYNPGGELVVSELYYDESPYIARVHDVNGMLLLLNLKVEILKNTHLNTEDIVRHSRFKNPFSNEEFVVSKDTKTLSFTCESDFSQCAIQL